MLIRLAHSPDPDDAFMFYGLSSGGVDPRGYEFEHVLSDIQTLNECAARGEYEVSAISIHAYPSVADKYALMSCGCSMGDNYGPIVVTREPMSARDLKDKRIAIPGEMTTAFLTLQLLLGRGTFEHQVVMFDKILDEVQQGRFDAGLVIHEGQLTYESQGLHVAVDLGKWWLQRSGLPLPLGGNVIRRDLGEERCREVTAIIHESIAYALDHRDQAVDYALKFGRGLDKQMADKFVGMYVNEWTLDYGPRGREAVNRLLREGAQAGIVQPVSEIEFLA